MANLRERIAVLGHFGTKPPLSGSPEEPKTGQLVPELEQADIVLGRRKRLLPQRNVGSELDRALGTLELRVQLRVQTHRRVRTWVDGVLPELDVDLVGVPVFGLD